jgi:uncharacterized membrane protein YdjX (TVP38/TMEM64 family)
VTPQKIRDLLSGLGPMAAVCYIGLFTLLPAFFFPVAVLALAGGLLSGLDRKSAAKFSFMMSAPAIAGAMLLEGLEAVEQGWFNDLQLLPTLLGVAVACISGYLAIRFMLALISRVSLNWFALYVAILGLGFLVLQLTGFPSVPAFSPDSAKALLHVALL